MATTPPTPPPCGCAADDARPEAPQGFGWVVEGWARLLGEWDAARKVLGAAKTPAERDAARWRVDRSAAALWVYKDEMARGLSLCLRWAAEFQRDALNESLGPLVATVAGEKADPHLEDLRGRVAAVERQIEVVLERFDRLVELVNDLGAALAAPGQG